MQECEKILFENCHNRAPPTQIDIKEAFKIEEEIPAYFATGKFDAARITKDNAVSLLHSYVWNYNFSFNINMTVCEDDACYL